MTSSTDVLRECVGQMVQRVRDIEVLHEQAGEATTRLCGLLTAATREGVIRWGWGPAELHDRHINGRIIATEIEGTWAYVLWYPVGMVSFRCLDGLLVGSAVTELMEAITDHYRDTGREKKLTRAHWDIDAIEARPGNR